MQETIPFYIVILCSHSVQSFSLHHESCFHYQYKSVKMCFLAKLFVGWSEFGVVWLYKVRTKLETLCLSDLPEEHQLCLGDKWTFKKPFFWLLCPGSLLGVGYFVRGATDAPGQWRRSGHVGSQRSPWVLLPVLLQGIKPKSLNYFVTTLIELEVNS